MLERYVHVPPRHRPAGPGLGQGPRNSAGNARRRAAGHAGGPDVACRAPWNLIRMLSAKGTSAYRAHSFPPVRPHEAQ